MSALFISFIPMLIFHTADWHLGASLANRRRTAEQQAFLDWLVDAIAEHRANALIIAGDVFDTTTPPNHAQEQYFRFLSRLAKLPDFRHAIIVAGNHDSPSFLDAPAPMLHSLNIHVMGSAKAQPADEVLCLNNDAGELEWIVCAVPYLRERDVRTSDAGESQADKNQKVINGTAKHYAQTFDTAQAIRANRPIPIVATGHLFCTASANAPAQEAQGDGVRELYVGTLNRFPAHLFPNFDYVALGHLHVPQTIRAPMPIRYAGSPIAMGFGEANQQKSITTIQFNAGDTTPIIDTLAIPTFQTLRTIAGDWASIRQQIVELSDDTSIWLEIHYTGAEHIADLRAQLDNLVQDTPHHILKIRHQQQRERLLSQQDAQEQLGDLNPMQVFERCLQAHAIPEEQQNALIPLYHHALKTLEEFDPCA